MTVMQFVLFAVLGALAFAAGYMLVLAAVGG
jgi:hypothetical protein